MAILLKAGTLYDEHLVFYKTDELLNATHETNDVLYVD